MISMEFWSWLAKDWLRTFFMAMISALIAFMLVVSVALSIHHSQLQERQIQRLNEIEVEAQKARAEAARSMMDAIKTKQEVKQLEKSVREDH